MNTRSPSHGTALLKYQRNHCFLQDPPGMLEGKCGKNWGAYSFNVSPQHPHGLGREEVLQEERSSPP